MTDDLFKDLPAAERPLGVKTGDVVTLLLITPIRHQPAPEYGDDGVQEHVTIRIDHVSSIGLQGTGSEDTWPIVPSDTRSDASKLDGTGEIEFFPWSAILRMRLRYTSEQYEALWQQAGE